MIRGVPLHQQNLGAGLDVMFAQRPASAPSTRERPTQIFAFPDGTSGPPPLGLGLNKLQTRSKPWNQRDISGSGYYPPNRQGKDTFRASAPPASWKIDEVDLDELREAAESEKNAKLLPGGDLADGEDSSYHLSQKYVFQPQSSVGPIGTRTAHYDSDGTPMLLRGLFPARAIAETKKRVDVELELAKTKALLNSSRAEIRKKDKEIAKLTAMCQMLKNKGVLDAEPTEVKKTAPPTGQAKLEPQSTKNARRPRYPKEESKPRQDSKPQNEQRAPKPSLSKKEVAKPAHKRTLVSRVAKGRRTRESVSSTGDREPETEREPGSRRCLSAEESLVDLGSQFVAGPSFDQNKGAQVTVVEFSARTMEEESHLAPGSRFITELVDDRKTKDPASSAE